MGVAAAQRQTAVTAYLKSKQLLLFGFKLRCWSLSNLITTDKLAVEQTHSGLFKKTAGLNSHMRSGVSREGGPEHPPPFSSKITSTLIQIAKISVFLVNLECQAHLFSLIRPPPSFYFWISPWYLFTYMCYRCTLCIIRWGCDCEGKYTRPCI